MLWRSWWKIPFCWLDWLLIWLLTCLSLWFWLLLCMLILRFIVHPSKLKENWKMAHSPLNQNQSSLDVCFSSVWWTRRYMTSYENVMGLAGLLDQRLEIRKTSMFVLFLFCGSFLPIIWKTWHVLIDTSIVHESGRSIVSI